MKPLIITLFSLFIFGFISNDKLTPTSTQIDIDGTDIDWPQLKYFDKKVGILYGVTYDTNYLYVLVKAHEVEAKRRILSSGLTVWLNPDGKKKKKIGVKYPIMEMGPGKGKGMERNKSPEIMLDESQLGNMMVQGIFSDDMEILQKHYLKTDLDVMIGFDSTQNLLYEMKIPLDLLKQKAKDNFEKIAVGFEVTEHTRPTGGAPQGGSGRGQNGGTRPSGGRAGGGGGGGGRGEGPPSASGSQTTAQKLTSWYLAEF